MATRSDIEVVCGSDQLCVGLKAEIEDGVHAMSDLYDTIDSIGGWGVLLVDTSNAFNSFNRIAMLLHAHVLWPRCFCFFCNTYHGWSVPVLRDYSDFLYNKEGIICDCLCDNSPCLHILHSFIQITVKCL